MGGDATCSVLSVSLDFLARKRRTPLSSIDVLFAAVSPLCLRRDQAGLSSFCLLESATGRTFQKHPPVLQFTVGWQVCKYTENTSVTT